MPKIGARTGECFVLKLGLQNVHKMDYIALQTGENTNLT